MAVVTSMVLGGLAVAGQVASYKQNREAQKEQKKIRQLEQRKQLLAQQRETRQAIAARQRATASQEAQAVSQGIQNSSSFFGATGAVGSQTAANMGFANMVNSITNQQSRHAQKAADNQYRSQVWGGLAGLAGQGSMMALGSATSPQFKTTGTGAQTNSSGIPVYLARNP